jgi:hypothetical protein
VAGASPQTRTVADYNPTYGGGSQSFTVDTPWTTNPDNTYTWEVYVGCDANGGGWPSMPEHHRAFVLPANPTGDDDSDGYTNLEEWLHTFPQDSTVVSNFTAYTDSTSGGSVRFRYQYQLHAKWDTDVAVKSRLQYRVNGTSSWSETSETAAASTSHFCVVTGLADTTTYQVRAVSNVNGVLSYGDIATATTYNAGPTISDFVVELVPNQASFSFTTSTSTKCRINLRKEPTTSWGAYEFTDVTNQTSHAHTITGLALSSVYDGYIQLNYSDNGDDTLFPDGAVAGVSGMVVFFTIETTDRNGDGGGYHFTQATSPAPVSVPLITELRPNRPNPFNPTTTIEFSLARQENVTLAVYDVTGRLVKMLLDEPKAAGRYQQVWEGRDNAGAPLASGVYFLRMNAGTKSFVRKMVMLK